MSRTIAITLSALAFAAAGACGTAGEDCPDCLQDHTGAPDAGAGDPGDPAGGALSIDVLATQVRDETDDAVSFGAGGRPRAFDHAGPIVELGADGGCPVVHKHAFLLRPDHGAEESPAANPVELRFRASADAAVGVDPAGAAYRVRAQGASEWLTDWLPAPEQDGAFTAAIDRAAVPELVATAGPYEIEMRGRDLAGGEASAIRCVDLRLLAGPLAVGPAQAAPRFSLAYRDPVSPILNGRGAWPVIRVSVSNGTSDPVYARFDRSAVNGACSKRWQRWNVLGSISTGAQSCETSPSLCAAPDLDPAIDHDEPVTCSPSLAAVSTEFDLRVAVDGVALAECAGCAAHQYRLAPHTTALVSLVAVDVPGLQPRETSEAEQTYADQEVLYRTGTSGAGGCPGSTDCASMFVTGAVTTRSGCSKTALIGDELFCTERRTYKMVRALTAVSATFDQLSIDLSAVALDPDRGETPPTGYQGPAALSGYQWSTSAGSNVPDA